ncbi:hypothetical protein VaNZ11_011549 [Volvox africanus]|uniref:Uncharacterized protein n=1 Tax=Volvox africanus TaxID=51714 RepID=A0ABQ5SCU9_9CHLO|nr:hypothetical protein VaNZ11_011549 [Volvox africanus]
MPVSNNHARGQRGADALLRADMDNYRKAWEKMRIAEKINNDRALEQRLIWEKLKKINPNPTDEDLLAYAHRLEDQGLLAEAADVYQQLLLRPDHFHNVHLRDHLAELIKKVNRRQAEAKVLERAAELEEEGRLWPGRPRGLESPRGRIPGVPRADKPVGPVMPMSPEAYRAELAAQAMENRRRREEAKKEEELRGQKEVAIAAAMEALDRHRRQVVGGNDRLAFANDLEEERKERQEERRRQFYAEWDQYKPVAGPSVRQSFDLEGLRRQQDEAVADKAQHFRPNEAAAMRQRPASAGAGAAAAAVTRQREREQERDRNNAANLARLYLPGHPYAPAGGPPPPHEAWPAPPPAGSPRPGPAPPPGALKDALKSPYARPSVDKPHVRIDPQVVRAHQHAFIEKHRKPPPPPQQITPLRQRKEAVRKPDPPIIGGGGYTGAVSYGRIDRW